MDKTQHITQGLPADVKSGWFSGKLWYAASTETLGGGPDPDKSKAVGCGDTLEAAIADMRDLVSRYIPFKERKTTWRPEDRFREVVQADSV